MEREDDGEGNSTKKRRVETVGDMGQTKHKYDLKYPV